MAKAYVFLKNFNELSERNKNRKLQENTDTTDGELSADDPPKSIPADEATEKLPKKQVIVMHLFKLENSMVLSKKRLTNFLFSTCSSLS